ncbi:MAG: chaperonin family protein RbcX [Cyanobacteria bacterium P01_D01_bin.105]
MDLKRIAKDTAQVLISYLTYQAVRTVLGQLKETNLPRYHWLHEFSSRDRLQDGEAYIQALFNEQPELALRIMTVRKHLAEEVAEFLPEMLTTGIQQANMEHRKKHLERMTQMTSDQLSASAGRGTEADRSGQPESPDFKLPDAGSPDES